MNFISLKNFLFYSLILAALSACSESNIAVTEEPILRPVRTITVSEPHGGPKLEFPAVVDAANSADLSFKVSGEIISLLVKQGSHVKKDDLIAILDDSSFTLALDEAQASFDKTKADFGRAKQLISSGTISQADYDQLKAQLASATSKLSNAKNNLNYTQLHAPFSGIVARTNIEAYEEIQAKQKIVTLQDIQRIKLKINVPESIMFKVTQDTSKHTYAVFSGIENKQFPLSFVEISTKADDVTKTYEITLGMETIAGYNILPGMTAQVLVTQSADEKHNYVPIKSVLKDQSGNYVWTVVRSGNNKGSIVKTSIEVGNITEFGFSVLSGLNAGDKVVTAGMSKISEGQTVKLSEEL